MTTTKNKKSGLGKGLSALLQHSDNDAGNSEIAPVGSITNIPVANIQANPFQPRMDFEDEPLRELSNSIKTHGVIQPITVRKMGRDKYQIISGERRTRATMMAGLDRIPAYIRVARDQEMLEMAIVENLHRENLNALEIAQSYQRLIEECNLKHEELSDRVGKDRSTVSNYLRLLKLPEEIQLALKLKQITMGHAKAILALDDITDQLTLLKRITDENLSVRKAEELSKTLHETDTDTSSTNTVYEKIDLKAYSQFQQSLSNKFGVPVTLKASKSGGSLQFVFEDVKQLEKLIARLA